MNQTILALLARIPADHWGFDLVALAVAAGACALVLFGIVTPDQLPSLVDAVFYGLGLIGVRGASLLAKQRASKAAAEGLALAEAVKAHDVQGALERASAVAEAGKV